MGKELEHQPLRLKLKMMSFWCSYSLALGMGQQVVHFGEFFLHIHVGNVEDLHFSKVLVLGYFQY